jgi:hypothetical protein
MTISVVKNTPTPRTNDINLFGAGMREIDIVATPFKKWELSKIVVLPQNASIDL